MQAAAAAAAAAALRAAGQRRHASLLEAPRCCSLETCAASCLLSCSDCALRMLRTVPDAKDSWGWHACLQDSINVHLSDGCDKVCCRSTAAEAYLCVHHQA